jgi:hypothetical protein
MINFHAIISQRISIHKYFSTIRAALSGRFVVILMLAFFPFFAQAQEIISTAGSQYGNGNINFTYTIGEPFVQSYSNNNNQLTEGFQQPYYLTIVNTNEVSNQLQTITIYPNPTAEKIMVQFVNLDKNTIVKLSDETGKIIFENILQNNITEIDMQAYAVGIYYLQVFENQQLIASKKIIKK